LEVSSKETFPLGDRVLLPTPTIVVVKDQLPVVPPVWRRLPVVGYKPVTVTLCAVEELVKYVLGALNIAVIEWVPIPPSSRCRTALPFAD
jgi:hypothetical protein